MSWASVGLVAAFFPLSLGIGSPWLPLGNLLSPTLRPRGLYRGLTPSDHQVGYTTHGGSPRENPSWDFNYTNWEDCALFLGR